MANGRTVLGVLGAIAFVEPVEITLRSERKRRLLAALALTLADGRTATVDRLADFVWASEPPRTARHALHVYVAELRSQLGQAGAGLVTMVDGYRLDPRHITTDAQLVEELDGAARAAAVAGRFDEAVVMYEEALARWRGEPYAGFEFDDVAVVERARLDALRAGLRDELATAYLALGRHTELIPRLQARITEEPLRELAYEQLMVALYRTGRQSEALDVYRRARHTLVEQVGLEPGPRLVAMERAVLQQDVAVLEPVAPWEVPTPPRRPFVGRVAELAELAAATGHARADGSTHVVLVGGEPGIGKTRLIDEWAGGLDGWTVLRGRCPADAGVPALWPFGEALRSVDVSKAAAGVSSRDTLGPLLGLLGHDPPTVSAGLTPVLSRPEPFQLHDAVAEFVTNAITGPAVIVIDDAHWSDESTLGVVIRLAERPPSGPLLVVLTHRVADVDRSEPFDQAVARLVRGPHVGHITLGPLARTDEVALLDGLQLGLSAEDVSLICARSEGNPFYLRELANLVTTDGGERAATVLPDSLRRVLEVRLAGVADDEILSSAALIGRVFDTGLLARIGVGSADAISRALAAAVRSGVIERADSNAWQFTHALFVDAAADQLDDDRRRRIHLRVADVLDSRRHLVSQGVAHHGVGSEGTLGEVARHRVAALPLGDPIAAATACIAAGNEQLATFAYEAAAASFGAAQAALDHAESDDRLLGQALVGEAEALAAAGASGRAVEVIEIALPRIDRDRDPELFALAVRVLVLHRSTAASVGDERLARLLTEAIDGLGDRPVWLGVQLRCDLGLLHYRTEGSRRSEEVARDALRLASESDDLLARTLATTALHQSMWRPATLDERRDLAEAGILTARELGLSYHESMATVFRAADSWEAGDFSHIEHDLATALDRAVEGRRPRFVWMARSWTALLDLYRDDRFGAEAGFAEALAAWGPNPNPDAVQCFFAQQLTLRMIDGDTTDMIDGLRQVAAGDPNQSMWNALLSYPYVLAGRQDEAHRSLDEVMAAGIDTLPEDVTHHVCLAMLAEAASVLGRRDVATDVERVLTPFAERRIVSNVYGGGGICWGSVAHQLGECAVTRGDAGRAGDWFRRAVEHHRMDGAVAFQARSEARLAAMR